MYIYARSRAIGSSLQLRGIFGVIGGVGDCLACHLAVPSFHKERAPIGVGTLSTNQALTALSRCFFWSTRVIAALTAWNPEDSSMPVIREGSLAPAHVPAGRSRGEALTGSSRAPRSRSGRGRKKQARSTTDTVSCRAASRHPSRLALLGRVGPGVVGLFCCCFLCTIVHLHFA